MSGLLKDCKEDGIMKKLLAALLTMALIISVLPAALADEAPELITLTVFRGDPGDQPTEDNKIYKLIEEKFGVKFNFSFLTGDLDETLGIKIVGKDYPDLFDGGNSADLIINGGALINLLDYVSAEKTPRLWAHIEPQLARLIRKDANGNDVLYIIPNYGLADGDQIALSVGGPAFFIQKQVLAWDNYPTIKTCDEYFDLLERFIDANPTDENGTPYTGFAILCEDWRHFCLINPVQHLMGRPNDGEVVIDPATEDFHTETFIDKPYAKAYYKKLNAAYKAGLIDRSTFSMSYDQYIALISGGTVLGMFDQAWDFGTATAALQDAKMYDRTYVALGLIYSEEDLEGIALPTDTWKVEEHYLNGSLPNVNRGFGISVNCTCPERIVAMWEEMMSDEWQLIFNWGIEGEDYIITDDGRLDMTPEQYANTQNAEWKLANKAEAFTQSSPKKQGWILNDIQVGDKVVKAGNCWEPGNQDEIVFGQMNEYDKEFLSAYGFKKFADFVNPPIELAPYGEAWQIDYTPVNTAHDNFLKVQDNRLPELIQCDEAEFDAKWDEFVAEIKPFADEFGAFMQEAVYAEAQKVVGNK